MEVYNITRNEQTQKRNIQSSPNHQNQTEPRFQVRETMIYTVRYYLLQGPLPCWHRLCMTRCYQMQKMYRKAVYYQLFYPSFWWKCYQHLRITLYKLLKLIMVSRIFWAEYSPLTWFSECWITLAPHDTDWLSLDFIKVHCVNGSFGIGWLLEIDISITKRASSNHITTDSNWQDWASLKVSNDHQWFIGRFYYLRKFFVKHGFCGFMVKVSDVKTRHRIRLLGCRHFLRQKKMVPPWKNWKFSC